jgi:hypothetical protein
MAERWLVKWKLTGKTLDMPLTLFLACPSRLFDEPVREHASVLGRWITVTQGCRCVQIRTRTTTSWRSVRFVYDTIYGSFCGGSFHEVWDAVADDLAEVKRCAILWLAYGKIQ